MAFSPLDSSLLGPLFATDAMRDAFSDRAALAAMIEVEAALAVGLARAGLAPEGLAAAVRAIDPASLDVDALGRATAVAGVPVIPFVKAVEARLPPDLAPFLHLGATTQDVADTALGLQMRKGLLVILPDLIDVLEGLCALAERHARTPCAGRTYGQHAAPVTFGFKATVWASGVAEVARLWQATYDLASFLALDGPVGTRAGWGAQAEVVADTVCEELLLSGSSIAWHTRRARRAEIGWWIALLLGALAKMAADVAHLASTEVGEVAEPHAPGRGGSSAMPHKRNPAGATLILAAASAGKGHVGTLLDAMVAAHERPAGAWHAEWHALPALFGLASGALREGRSIAQGLVVDEARMAANLDLTRGLLYADRAAAALAPQLGRSAAHAAVERAAERVRAGAPSLREALAADPALAVAGEALDAAFDPAPAVDAAAARCARAVENVRVFTIDFLRDCPT
jgi:3-carboxy-cis,cis-muconate cycloisomerase